MFKDKTFEKKENLDGKSIEWERISTLKPQMTMFDSKGKNFNIQQGEIQDCFLISALLSVSLSASSGFDNLFVDKTVNSNSMQRFKFYDGFANKFKVITIDDYIPVKKKGNSFEPLFVSHESNEVIWPMLIEKAYAKFVGGYENIIGGSVSETMYDLTAYPTEDFNFSDKNTCSHLTDKKIESLIKTGKIATASHVIKELNTTPFNGKNNTIVKNHAYSIIKTIKVKKLKNKVFLVLKNPLGGRNSFIGYKNEYVKKNFGKIQANWLSKKEGYIKISIPEFKKRFNRLYITRILSKDHKEKFFHNIQWKNIGLASTRKSNFFSIKVKGKKNEKIEVIVTVSQKQKRNQRKSSAHRLEYDEIGFEVIKITKKKSSKLIVPVTGQFKSIYKTSLWNKRDVSSSFSILANQEYHILPKKYQNKEESNNFSLKVNCLHDFTMKEEKSIPLVEIDSKGYEKEDFIERNLFSSNFNPNAGKIDSKFSKNPKFFLYVEKESEIALFLTQKTKKLEGVGIFVFKNTTSVPKNHEKNAYQKIGYSNPKELSLKFLGTVGLYLIVFSHWKKGVKSPFDVSVISNGFVHFFKTKKELLESQFKNDLNNLQTKTKTKTKTKKVKVKRITEKKMQKKQRATTQIADLYSNLM